MEDFQRRVLVENRHGVHKPQRGQNGSPILLGYERSLVAFQAAHGGVAVDSEDEHVSQLRRLPEQRQVAGVQQVITTIREDDPFAGHTPRGRASRQLVTRQDLAIGARSESVPDTPGIHRKRTDVANRDTGCRVRQLGRSEQRSIPRQRECQDGNGRVASASDVVHLPLDRRYDRLMALDRHEQHTALAQCHDHCLEAGSLGNWARGGGDRCGVVRIECLSGRRLELA